MNITFTGFASLCSLLLLSFPPPSLSTKYNKQDKNLLNQLFTFHTKKCHEEDRKVLKQIEKEIAIPPYFQSWTPDNSDCCQWHGVFCDETTSRVNALVINVGSVVSGKIPDAVGDLPYLKHLVFKTCPNLTGPIPQSVTKLTNLTFLWFSGNSLSGPIPSFLSKLKNLEYIFLNSNKFSGPIPESLSQLEKLFSLRLDGNRLTGTIPESLGKNPLQRYISIGNNQLTGKVPKSFGNSDFYTLDFSNNKLEGDISFLFGKNKTLLTADFSSNMFEFDMSKVEFSTNLIYLDLNDNKIYGSLPEGMTKLILQTFNVSYNSLCGKIPTGGWLQKYEKTVYSHNRCLCGAPLAACK